MKKIFAGIALAVVALTAAAQEDPIVMRIGGVPVTRSEFEYNYNKNNSEGVIDKKNVEEYAELFVNYKLKVLSALDNHLDTLTSYQKEFRTYRDQLIRPLLVPEGAKEKECKAYYDGMLARLEGKQLLQPAHILIRLPQDATEEQQAMAKAKIDSIHQALKDGADFAELAQTVSQDPGSAARGGMLPWIGPNQVVKEFEDVAYSLEVNEVSEPFLMPFGYDIVKLMGKKDLEPYEELHDMILKYLEGQGLENQLAQQVLDSIASQSNGEKTIEQILDEKTEEFCAKDSELKYLVQEYHDGLLLFEECNSRIWEPAAKDTLALTTYFKKNKKNYAWDEPRYRGMVYYCKDAADVKAVKKLVKKQPTDKWMETIRETFNKDSIMVRVERRIFKKGDNSNVDRLALKVKSAELKPVKGYPHIGIFGKVLKKGPAEWTDVSNQVVSDYQRLKEDEFVAELRKRYTVEIDKEALKTVNNH
ncbi:MAG: peptidylprolyl isomerase [Bacteroidaceae bacterium]|jgi:peptidyl-prolyl cis-trans isomerase SurA|nr:peptidylprolyl isomerase [Bacteroidaceae bacterium]MBQ5680227.1 peptidylprolyl isomerase [Bacteroidaceae bacterium]MBQ5713119.1 peptidylprolyl isomerase [Bacteroidaceae bacterium]MBQ5871363.1 peptidylprolyl isomerase [Bacteroidaceae bacterium]